MSRLWSAGMLDNPEVYRNWLEHCVMIIAPMNTHSQEDILNTHRVSGKETIIFGCRECEQLIFLSNVEIFWKKIKMRDKRVILLYRTCQIRLSNNRDVSAFIREVRVRDYFSRCQIPSGEKKSIVQRDWNFQPKAALPDYRSPRRLEIRKKFD